MKRRCFLILVVDGTRVFGAKARVGSCMFQRKVVVASVRHGDEGHVCREFM